MSSAQASVEDTMTAKAATKNRRMMPPLENVSWPCTIVLGAANLHADLNRHTEANVGVGKSGSANARWAKARWARFASPILRLTLFMGQGESRAHLPRQRVIRTLDPPAPV